MNIDDAFRTGFIEGKKATISKVLEIISLLDTTNSVNIKEDPSLAPYLLLELVEKVQQLEEK